MGGNRPKSRRRRRERRRETSEKSERRDGARSGGETCVTFIRKKLHLDLCELIYQSIFFSAMPLACFLLF